MKGKPMTFFIGNLTIILEPWASYGFHSLLKEILYDLHQRRVSVAVPE
jgi:hypothetical protein